jgi:hypothetical protein
MHIVIDIPIHVYQSKIISSITALFRDTPLGSDHLASGCIVDGVAVGTEDTEAGRLVVILVGIPEHVHLVESFASDGVPESLSIVNRSDLVRKSVIAHSLL